MNLYIVFVTDIPVIIKVLIRVYIRIVHVLLTKFSVTDIMFIVL